MVFDDVARRAIYFERLGVDIERVHPVELIQHVYYYTVFGVALCVPDVSARIRVVCNSTIRIKHFRAPCQYLSPSWRPILLDLSAALVELSPANQPQLVYYRKSHDPPNHLGKIVPQLASTKLVYSIEDGKGVTTVAGGARAEGISASVAFVAGRSGW